MPSLLPMVCKYEKSTICIDETSLYSWMHTNIPNVEEYEALSNGSLDKVNEMMDKIRNSRYKSVNSTLHQASSSNAAHQNKAAIGCKKKPAKLPIYKNIKIGILVKTPEGDSYKCYRKVTGALKFMKLQEGSFYNAKQILDAAIDIFCSPTENENYYENCLKIISESILRLGDVQGHEDIFFNLDNINYSVWDYISRINTPPSRIVLYILAKKLDIIEPMEDEEPNRQIENEENDVAGPMELQNNNVNDDA